MNLGSSEELNNHKNILANLLRKSKDQILAQWQTQVRREIERSSPFPNEVIIDGAPRLLEELAQYFESQGDKYLADGSSSSSHHGAERARLENYTFEAVSHEYHLLRKVIISILEENKTLTIDDRERIQDFIQAAMVRACSEFLQIQNDAQMVNAIRLSFATEAAQIGIWEYSFQTGIIWRTRTHDSIFGFKNLLPKWDEESFKKILHLNDRDRVMAFFKESEKSASDWIIEYRIVTPQGEIRSIESKGRTICDSKGRPQKLIGANIDVTERKQAFEERMNYAAMAHLDLETLKTEREIRERFVSTLTHDLRSPLTAAKVSAQMLLRKIGDAEIQTKSAVRILNCIERTDRMIQDLLDANTITAGQEIPIKVVHCDFHNLLTSSMEEMILVHGSRFEIKCRDGVEGYWDYNALRRVLENLVNNAVKYGSDGQITVAVEQLDDSLEVKVHNFGGELSASDQKVLFEQFRRLTSAKQSSHRGWGIGLTLVRGIVKAHGGTIKVDSGKGEGTTFTMSLPNDARPLQKK